MAARKLDSILGFHDVKSNQARDLLLPFMKTDGHYLLRPSSDNKGGVLCTICVTNRNKLVNYRLVRDKGTYYIHSNATFSSIPELLTHYKTNPINRDANTRLLSPVLTEAQKTAQQIEETADMYVIMERTTEDTPPPNQEDENLIPGLHLYLPKAEIDSVMSQYLGTDGYYLVRPSASAENQLTLAVSYGGRVLNFKINNDGGNEFYISPRYKHSTVQELLRSYASTPIRSKRAGSAKIFLRYPIPVDPVLEKKHKKMLEDKAARKKETSSKRKASSPPPVQDPLPEPWQEHMDQQYNKCYYYNPETEESTWVRPKATPPPVSMPHRANTHTGGRMKGRPLPGVPGQGSSANGPPLPSKGQPMQNGMGPDFNTPRERLSMPPLPPKDIGSLQHQSPQHQPLSATSKRPPMPLPTDTTLSDRRSSCPPLPPKEDNLKASQGLAVPPLPPKEDSPALPRKPGNTRKHQRIVECEDTVPTSKPPPLPEKETPALNGNIPTTAPPLPPGRSQAPPTGGAPPPLPPGRSQPPPTGGAPPLPPGRSQPPPTGGAPPLPPGRSQAPPTDGAPPLPPGRSQTPSTSEVPPLPPGRPNGRASPLPARTPPPLPPQESSPAPPLPPQGNLANKAPPPLPPQNDAPPLPPQGNTRFSAGGPPPPPVRAATTTRQTVPPLPTRETAPSPPNVLASPTVTVSPPLLSRGDTSPIPPIDVTPPRGNVPAPPPIGGVPPPPPLGVPAPPPPPPMGAPPPSPAPVRPIKSESGPAQPSSPRPDTGSGRPFGANDLQVARTLLRSRADSTPSEPKEQVATGMAGILSNALDNRRKAVVDSESESEFEDVDDDWED